MPEDNVWEYNGCLIPKDLYYDIESQVWVKVNEDGTVTLGLTDVGQVRAGRLLYARIKKKGKFVKKGKPLASFESGKWAGPVPAVIEGEIVDINEKLVDQPDIINYDPYGEGWVVKVKPVDLERDLKDLVTGDEAIKKMKEYIDEWDIVCMRCT